MSNRKNYQNYNPDDLTDTSAPYGATMPPPPVFKRGMNWDGPNEYDATEPINSSALQGDTEPANLGSMPETEVVNELDVNGKKVEPVVGWLVGIKGCCRGRDFRLHSEYNFVGRGSSLDIVLDDARISTAPALQVLYDPATREFMALPGDTQTKRVAYCNGKPLVIPRTLEPYDRIQIGYDISQKDYIVELMFVPLCGEHFNWED